MRRKKRDILLTNGNLEKGGMFRLFPRLTPDEAGFRGKYGFIRFLQEILLDFTAAGEVYYNRFRMEQRAACAARFYICSNSPDDRSV